MKPKKSCIWFVLLLIVVILLPSFAFSNTQNSFQQYVITNQSAFSKCHAFVEIVLPPEWINQPCIVLSEADKETRLPFLRKSNETGDVLLVQLSFVPFEEKRVIVKKTESVPKNQQQIVTSQAPGTDFLFVNYKDAMLISTEENNKIQFFSNDGKQFLPESTPLVLGEGKNYTLTTSTPQLVRIQAEKPLFVYASSIHYQNGNASMEAGDSDTTTLYTDSGYIYILKHAWFSAYEETEVKLFDENGRNVLTKKITAHSGYFLDNLAPGPYRITSDHPITVQFGRLDDENFSFLFGRDSIIHGFAFGDLLIQSLYPDTDIEISWDKKEKQTYHFKNALEYQTYKPIETFLPKQPEFAFVTLESNHPVRVCTFSSGNNFGGEFIPGNSQSYKDKQFGIITTRVSKEFSKEQRNLIELIGLVKDTDVVIADSVNKKVTLQKNTHYDIPSSTPLDKITINGSEDMMVCQLHNYTNKGLFYFVPSLQDATLAINTADTLEEGIFQDGSDPRNLLISQYRINEFFRNIVHVRYWPLSLFFIGLIGILLSVMMMLLNKMEPSIKEMSAAVSDDLPPESVQAEDKPEKSDEKEIVPVIKETGKEEKAAFKYSIPDLNTSMQDVVYPTLRKAEEIPVFQHPPTPIGANEENSSPSAFQPVEPEPIYFPQSTEMISAKFDQIQNGVVLDPGSANRLFYENQLALFSNAFIVSSSTKKLSREVSEHLHKIDLNLQDQTRISNLLRSLPIMEESAKAIALCKKKKVPYYISSYSLPKKILDIQIIPVGEWKKFLLH